MTSFDQVFMVLAIPLFLTGLAQALMALWRRRLAMKDEEAYRRHLQWEQDEMERQRKMFRDGAAAGTKIMRRWKRKP